MSGSGDGGGHFTYDKFMALSISFPETNHTGPDYECTRTSPQYIPYNDTYPNRCQEYQRCVFGVASHEMCPGSMEFNQVGGSGPCDNPSNTTYCGQRRVLEPPPGIGFY